MNINQIFKPEPPATPPGSAMVVNYQTREVSATDWIHQLEAEVLARAGTVTKVDNAQQNALAYEAQASLARYIRAVQNTEKAIKDPLNALKAKVLALSKELIAQADAEGNRIGAMVADFQLLETKRVAAARRLQNEQTTILERDRDQKLAQASTVAEIEAIQEEYREQVMAQHTPEPARVKGQIIKDDWSVQIVDIWLLARAMPGLVKIEPRMSEIKAVLNSGTKVPGVLAERITKAGVRLTKDPEAIPI